MRRAVFFAFLLYLGVPLFSAESGYESQNSNSKSSLAPATELQIEAQSKQLPLAWLCKAKAFTKNYEALGTSRAEAKMNVKALCTGQNNEMHCKDIGCEGPDDGKPLGWVCKLSPFGKSYEAVGSSRAEAKLKCQKLCKAEYAEIFCEDAKCNEG